MLKIKEGFVLREIAGNWIVIPLGARVAECSAIISLNNCGALLWRCMEYGSDYGELLKKVMREYSIDEDTAGSDIREFIQAVKDKGLLEQ